MYTGTYLPVSNKYFHILKLGSIEKKCDSVRNPRLVLSFDEIKNIKIIIIKKNIAFIQLEIKLFARIKTIY